MYFFYILFLYFIERYENKPWRKKKTKKLFVTTEFRRKGMLLFYF